MKYLRQSQEPMFDMIFTKRVMMDNMPTGLAIAIALGIWFLNNHISEWIFLSGRVES